MRALAHLPFFFFFYFFTCFVLYYFILFLFFFLLSAYMFYTAVCAYDHTRCVDLFTFKQCKLSHDVDVRIVLCHVFSQSLISAPFVGFLFCCFVSLPLIHLFFIIICYQFVLLPLFHIKQRCKWINTQKNATLVSLCTLALRRWMSILIDKRDRRSSSWCFFWKNIQFESMAQYNFLFLCIVFSDGHLPVIFYRKIFRNFISIQIYSGIVLYVQTFELSRIQYKGLLKSNEFHLSYSNRLCLVCERTITYILSNVSF